MIGDSFRSKTNQVDKHQTTQKSVKWFAFFTTWDFLTWLMVTITTVLIYANTLHSPFVFDDVRSILENPYIRLHSISVEKLFDIIRHSGNRPLPALSFALNYYWGGYNPIGYHVFNIVIHALTGILFFHFIKLTATVYANCNRDQPNGYGLPIAVTAMLAALLWTTHPVNTQSVTYIVQRMNSLSTMFCLLSLLLYISGRLSTGKSRFFAFFFSIFSWVLAISSKENAAILPMLIVLYEWYFFQNLSREWLKTNLKYFVAGIVIISGVALLHLGLHPIEKLRALRDFASGEFSYSERLYSQARVIVYYLSLFIYPNPARLNFDYDFPLSHSLFDPWTTLPAAILLAVILIIGAWTSKNYRLMSFCIFWYFINLLIESSVIPLAIIFEHRTYMPFMGLALLTVLLIDHLLKQRSVKLVILCGLILLASIWTFQRNQIWKSPITLWQDSVNKSPHKARPHLGLGTAYAEIGEVEKAKDHYKIALDLAPDAAEGYHNFGTFYAREGNFTDAEIMYRKALEIEPAYSKAHYNLANVLVELNRYNEARQHYSEAIRLKPRDAAAHLRFGDLLNKLGQKENAFDAYKQALQLDPMLAAAHYNIGKLEIDRGDVTSAISHFKEALRIDPSIADAAVNLGNIAQDRGELDMAATYYQKALDSDPNNSHAHYNIARLRMQTGDRSDAENHLKQALQSDDRLVGAHVTLGFILEDKGETQKALEHYRRAIELDPHQAGAQNNIGNILAGQQKFEAAIPHYQEAIRLDPKFEDAHVNLGIALLRMGDADGAKQQFEQALQLNPSNPGARQGMEILQSSEQAPTGDTPDVLHRKALEHADRGEYQVAVELFKKILTIMPSEPGTCYNIACMYAKMGDTAAALEWLERAIQNGYDNWDAIKNDPDLDGIRQSEAYKTLVKGR